jgi:hypothetical protein
MLRDTTITNSIKGKMNFWQTLEQFFAGRIDDRLFAPSSISLYLRDPDNLQTPIYLLQQYQSKASIINPAVLYVLLHGLLMPIRGILKGGARNDIGVGGGSLFTPELSWSSYLLTFLASGNQWREYVGVDVMESAIQKSQKLVDLYRDRNERSDAPNKLSFEKSVTLLKTPSETLARNKRFLKKYTEHFDTVLYCPPYFDMEIYPDSSGMQSVDKYKTYAEWLEGYLYPTLNVCSTVLKRGGKMGCILGGYHKKLNGEFYDLRGDFLKWMAEAHPEMKLADTYFLKNRASPLKNNEKERGEYLHIYEKV